MAQTADGSNGSAGRGARQAPGLRPRLSVLDIALQLWRAKWLMLLVFLPILALGLAAVMTLPRSYTATSRLLVSLGDEYVYRPSVGRDGAGGLVSPEIEALVQSELELFRSPVVAEAALSKVTLERLYPDIARSCEPERCARLGVNAIMADLSVGGAPKNLVIVARFKHRNAALSAELLNAVVAAYLDYRADVFTNNRTDGFREQRERSEQELASAEHLMRQYLLTNNLTNIDAESDTLRQLYQSASSELLLTQSRMRQLEAQLASYRTQINSIEPEQDLYVDDSSQATLLDLKIEREEKLSRYRPESRVIVELDKRIAQTEAYLASREGAAGIVRRGPNPLYQQVEASIATLKSEVQALRSQEAELKSQIEAFETRQRRIVQIEPEFQELERRREVAEQSVRAFAEREAEERARDELTQQSVNNIRTLEPAAAPIKGSSLKMPAAIAVAMFAAFTALIVGLIRALTRSGFATAGSLERTLGLPVLATIQKY